MKLMQVGIKHLNCELCIVLQKSSQNISFVPCSALENPFARVFKGIKNVMKMNKNSAVKDRKYLKDNVVDVAAGLRNMR